MIDLRFSTVPAERVAPLRDWLGRSTERIEELEATMRDEGVTEERVALKAAELVPLPAEELLRAVVGT